MKEKLKWVLITFFLLTLSGCGGGSEKEEVNKHDVNIPAIQVGEATTTGVNIVNHKASYSEYGNLLIKGVVKNTSTTKATFVNITATCKDSTGDVVATQTAYAEPHTIPAGGESPFEVLISWKTKPATCNLSTARYETAVSSVTTPSPPVNLKETPKSNVKPSASISSTSTSKPPVKMSGENRICYQRGSKYYDWTEFYAPYNSIKECLADGGKLSNPSPPVNAPAYSKPQVPPQNYNEPTTSVPSASTSENAVNVSSDCTAIDEVWKHVYHPDRLQIIKKCQTVTGTVMLKRKEADGDFHILVKLDPQYEWMLNDKNRSAQKGCLVIEPICQLNVTQEDAKAGCEGYKQPVPVPNVGDRVEVTGDYVLDAQHGWNEIHPIARIEINGMSPQTQPEPPQSYNKPTTSIPSAPTSESPVKMSKKGICHVPGSTYYDITTNYKPYNSLDECIKAGGRLPKK